jgi:hypothetical protein
VLTHQDKVIKEGGLKNMLKKSGIFTIGIALAIGLLAGSLSLGAISAIADSDNSNVAPNYKVNAHGQTYGTNMASTSVQFPDLIQAQGTDGTIGYIKKADLDKDQPQNPQEAVAYMEKMKNAPAYSEIPLYASDGDTVIGKFEVFNSASDAGQAELAKQEAAAKAAAVGK